MSYPDWVPLDVIEYRSNLSTNSDLYGEQEISVLDEAIMSLDMERVWKAIAKRQEKANPMELVHALMQCNYWSRQIDDLPTKDDVQIHRNLAADIRKLTKKLRRSATTTLERNWNDWRSQEILEEVFLIPPLDAMERFAAMFDAEAEDMQEWVSGVEAFVGQRNAAKRRRHYVIRFLSNQMARLYGQPLHDTVAHLTGIILGEPIDSEQVRLLWRPRRR